MNTQQNNSLVPFLVKNSQGGRPLAKGDVVKITHCNVNFMVVVRAVSANNTVHGHISKLIKHPYLISGGWIVFNADKITKVYTA